ncbi:MAG: hypothetical protein PHT77_05615 [Bacteroidales bacterium]|nr:hypothetical protein [Bacteroidales bacterium]
MADSPPPFAQASSPKIVITPDPNTTTPPVVASQSSGASQPMASGEHGLGSRQRPVVTGEYVTPEGDVFGFSNANIVTPPKVTPSISITAPKTQSTSPESIAAANLAAERNAAYRRGEDMIAWEAAHAPVYQPIALTPEQDAAQEEAKHQAAFHGGGITVDVSKLANMSLSSIESIYGSATAEKTQEYFRANPTQRFQEITNLAAQQRYNIIGSSGLQQYMGQTADKSFSAYTEAGGKTLFQPRDESQPSVVLPSTGIPGTAFTGDMVVLGNVGKVASPTPQRPAGIGDTAWKLITNPLGTITEWGKEAGTNVTVKQPVTPTGQQYAAQSYTPITPATVAATPVNPIETISKGFGIMGGAIGGFVENIIPKATAAQPVVTTSPFAYNPKGAGSDIGSPMVGGISTLPTTTPAPILGPEMLGPVRTKAEAIGLGQISTAAKIEVSGRAGYHAGAPVGSQQWAENLVELSSAYHNIAQATGKQQAANPFEYTGDLALSYLKGTSKESASSTYGENITDTSILNLPGGMGIQDVAWQRAKVGKGGEQPAIYAGYEPAISAIQKSVGQYGPYATLYGGPEYGATAVGATPIVPVAITPSAMKPETKMMDLGQGVAFTGEMKVIGSTIPTGQPTAPSKEYAQAVLGGYSGGLVGYALWGEKSPEVIKGAMFSGLDFVTGIAGWTPGRDIMKTEAPGLQQFRAEKASRESELASMQAYGKSKYGVTPEGEIQIDISNVEARKFQEKYETARTGHTDFMKGGVSKGLTVYEGGKLIENPELTYDYGEFTKWGMGAGSQVRSTLGFSTEQLKQYQTQVEQKTGIETIPEKLVFGAGYTLSTHPEKFVSAYVGGAGLVLGGEVVGAVAEVPSVAARLGAFGAAYPTITAVSRGLVTYGVPAALTGLTYYSASEGFTATPERTTVNIGKGIPELAGVMYGGVGAYGLLRAADLGYIGFGSKEIKTVDLRKTVDLGTVDIPVLERARLAEKPTIDVSGLRIPEQALARKYQVDVSGLSTERTYTPIEIKPTVEKVVQPQKYQPFAVEQPSTLKTSEVLKGGYTGGKQVAIEKPKTQVIDLTPEVSMEGAEVTFRGVKLNEPSSEKIPATGGIKASRTLEQRHFKLGDPFKTMRRGTVGRALTKEEVGISSYKEVTPSEKYTITPMGKVLRSQYPSGMSEYESETLLRGMLSGRKAEVVSKRVQTQAQLARQMQLRAVAQTKASTAAQAQGISLLPVTAVVPAQIVSPAVATIPAITPVSVVTPISATIQAPDVVSKQVQREVQSPFEVTVPKAIRETIEMPTPRTTPIVTPTKPSIPTPFAPTIPYHEREVPTRVFTPTFPVIPPVVTPKTPVPTKIIPPIVPPPVIPIILRRGTPSFAGGPGSESRRLRSKKFTKTLAVGEGIGWINVFGQPKPQPRKRKR